jgi:hypothetical protein
MATNLRLTKILENAMVKLDKAKKSLERLVAKLAKEEASNEYTGCTEDDIRRKTREISDLIKSIDGYREKLQGIQALEEVTVLREFIERWKKSATTFYVNEHAKLIEYEQLLKSQQKLFEIWFKEETGYDYRGCYTPNKAIADKRTELGIDGESTKKFKSNNFSALTIQANYYPDWECEIDKYIQAEAERKYKNFLVRIKACVGNTLDCSGLYVSPNAEISGIAVGELGKVRVETITAGGYNIQCLHYRILINMID